MFQIHNQYIKFVLINNTVLSHSTTKVTQSGN